MASSRVKKFKLLKEFRVAFNCLDLNHKKKYLLLVIIGTLTGLFDFFGVIIFGVIGTLAVRGIQNINPSPRINNLLNIFGLEGENFKIIIAVLAFLGAFFLIVKSLLSIYVTRRQNYFLNNLSANISNAISKMIFSNKLVHLKSTSTQDIRFLVLNGSKALTMGILANTATVVADIFLLSLMIAVLMVTSPIVAVTTTSLFGVLALVLHRKQAKSAFWLGTKASEISRELDKYVTELAFGFKVVSVKGQINSRLDKIKSINSDLARVNAKASFLPSIGKYIIELSLITSLLFIVALQFILFDAAKSIGILTIFFIAGSRIAPAILRVQQSFLNIRANSGTAKIAADFIKGMSNIKSDQKINQNEKQEKVLNSTFVPEIELHNVTFKYSENETFQLHEINFKIAKGSKIAFVGHSGSGKSTLVDLILGLLIPKSGYVRISGLDPEHAIARWPGSIGYLPQETILLQASLKENIIFGEHLMHESDAEIWKLLDLVKLKDKFDLMPNGLDTLLGEGNMSLSGGEKQRLGLARALYSKPSLLVLDEATSALDATTEEAVMKTIFELNSEFTVIMIAHRLSTVINSDEIYLFDGGKLMDTGTFKDLNSRSSIFMQLVNLMQLSEQKE